MKNTLETNNNQLETVQTISVPLRKSALSLIMEKQNMTKHIAQEQEEKIALEYNVNNFFTEDNPKGFISKAEFVDTFQGLMKFEIEGFILFLNQISERIKLNIPPITNTWAVTQREYYRVSFGVNTVLSKYQLVKFPFIEKLVMYYTFDMAIFNLNFDELFFYANN